ncbi:MAG: nucleotidyltransferase domain-containing protein [Candidatus Melainabacteria bacterium]|jgi:uncharacterized protein|nr:nucleotidyltransferase domain-containing protein [Candidatus Melainabacteria bacterium]
MDSDFEQFITSIVSNYKPEKVLLFGSRAWGKPEAGSDYDVLVMLNTDSKNARKEAVSILENHHPGTIAIDLMVKKPEYINKMIQMGDPFTKKILEKGKLLYERDSQKMD